MPESPFKRFPAFAAELFPDASEQVERLESALKSGSAARPAAIWMDGRPETLPFKAERLAEWQPAFVDAAAKGERPGAHPLHDAGAYYALDFSSIVSASVTLAISERPRIILDLCASPG